MVKGIYNIDNFPYQIFKNVNRVKRSKGNQSTKSKQIYLDLICAFDIETSTIPDIEQSFMYIWQFQVDSFGTVIGRTWEDYIDFLSRVWAQMEDNEYLFIGVHNLSFEFQFLKGIYPFKQNEVFATDSRKVARCTMYDHFEYRCTLFLSNMSLDKWLQSLKVEHKKLDGDKFNYKKLRFSDTVLSDYELEYCINDVRGLVEALRKTMQSDRDTFYTIPMTSTGYVRRDVKEAMRLCNKQKLRLENPDLSLYKALRRAMRGGDTHANRYFSDEYITGDIEGADEVSAYIAVIMCDRVPRAGWNEIHMPSDETMRKIVYQDKAFLADIVLYDVKLKDISHGVPYIAKAKCDSYQDIIEDNGRILEAKWIALTVTDVDLIDIIQDEYEIGGIDYLHCWYSEYGFIPYEIRKTVMKYYTEKTQLKGVKSTPEFDAEYYYGKAKNKLNSIYGLMAQDPIRQNIYYKDNGANKCPFDLEPLDNDTMQSKLDDANKWPFVMYAWGCWITANARRRLHLMIREVHNKGCDFLYCDTDSVYYRGHLDMTEINERLRQEAIEHKAYAKDRNGKTYYMGLWDLEHIDDTLITEFKTMGAKKYVYREKNGKLTCTISGVNKKKGAKELEKYGGVPAFHEGFIFTEAGGNELKYNDHINDWIDIDGHNIHITDNVCIKDSTYTVTLSPNYARLLSNLNQLNNIRKLTH